MLRRYTWESQKKKLQHYKRRQPETSVLYQIVYHGHEELQHVWEPRFQHQYGCLLDDVVGYWISTASADSPGGLGESETGAGADRELESSRSALLLEHPAL
jgi:hypothetical protein